MTLILPLNRPSVGSCDHTRLAPMFNAHNGIYDREQVAWQCAIVMIYHSSLGRISLQFHSSVIYREKDIVTAIVRLS